MNHIPLTSEKIATYTPALLEIHISMKTTSILNFETRLRSLHDQGKHDCKGALELSEYITLFKNELHMLQEALQSATSSSTEPIVFHEGWALCPF